MSGSFQRRRRRPEINLVPLIDVLVMLIFFAFVTMQFRSASMLNITLPKITTAGKNEFKGTVTIGIDKAGTLLFNDKVVTEDELVSLLKQVHDVDKDIPVLIKADEVSQVKKLAFVMDACRKAGLNKFSLQSR
ncbi:MAG TPA: biopolymer transporter ExbD [Candidatus Sulfotelmatobacter sp.]|nr:biopolymer transporter ExbD [Candidatus Sulfotelmatobacter sp.]